MTVFSILVTLYCANVFISNTFQVSAYPIISIFLITAILVNNHKLATDKYVITATFIFMLSSCFAAVVNGGIPGNYLQMIYIYIVQPLAVYTIFKNKLVEDRISASYTAGNIICFATIPIFLGSVYFYGVHLAGFPDPNAVFGIEFTTAGNSAVIRNRSFLGLSLILGGVSLVQFLLAQYMHRLTGDRFYLVISTLALLNTVFSISRRAILPILIFYVFYMILNPKRFAPKALIKIMLLGFAVYLVDPKILNHILNKFYSIFDIINDPSNVSRIKLISLGLEDIILRPWGLGFGALSSVGYSVDEVHSLDNVRVTESAIISFFGELGLVAATLICCMLYIKLRKIQINNLVLFILPIVVESIVGLGFYSPIVSFFTLSFIAIIYNLELSVKD